MSRFHFDNEGRRRGQGVAVDDSEYEALKEKTELLKEVQTAESQFSAGLAISSSAAREQILKGLKN